MGGKDALYIHGFRYAQRLEEAGVSVLVKEYPDAGHGFAVEGMVEGSQEALEQKAMSDVCDQFKVGF